MQQGVLRTVRDEAKALPTAMFTPRNIAKNSLKIDYRLSDDDTATAVKAQYHNGISWVNDTLTVSLDGDTSNPATVTLFGVTSEAQARREALYMARANLYRRMAVTFSTEMDGFILTHGDLIKVIHQQPNWGIAGEITSYNASILPPVSNHLDLRESLLLIKEQEEDK